MAWDFETDSDYAKRLIWVREFLDNEILPLETLLHDVSEAEWKKLTDSLKQQVKDHELWACHLDPELGGQGYGQVKLGLLHEILGRSSIAPGIFGNQAPDSGNAELLALGGDDEQKEKWLKPLLAGELRSAFSMTEPDVAGSDPTLIQTAAVLDGDEYVIDGKKWYTSNGSRADFLIVMAVTNPEVHPYQGSSMFVVPTDLEGVEIVRDVPNMHHPYPPPGMQPGGHAEVAYRSVRVPKENLIGSEGDGFVLAQKRLGPGRIHHAMRWIGQAKRAMDMMCERALTRRAHGSLLAEKQMIQDFIAETRIEIESTRLLCLYAAWHMDKHGSSKSRTEIAMIKVQGTKMLYNAIDRAIQVYGSLGYSADMPLEEMYRMARATRILDGPDEVHKVTIARQTLKGYEGVEAQGDESGREGRKGEVKEGMLPTEHIPTRKEAALKKFGDLLEARTANS